MGGAGEAGSNEVAGEGGRRPAAFSGTPESVDDLFVPEASPSGAACYHSTSFQISGCMVDSLEPISAKIATACLRWTIERSLSPMR